MICRSWIWRTSISPAQTWRAPTYSARDLTGARLAGSNLAGAHLDRMTIIRADFSGANLSGVTMVSPAASSRPSENPAAEAPALRRSQPVPARICWASSGTRDWTGADLSGAHLELGRMQFLAALRTDLSGGILARANLQDADLAGIRLEFADLRGANLAHANLEGADLAGARLDGANRDRGAVRRRGYARRILARRDRAGAGGGAGQRPEPRIRRSLMRLAARLALLAAVIGLMAHPPPRARGDRAG